MCVCVRERERGSFNSVHISTTKSQLLLLWALVSLFSEDSGIPRPCLRNREQTPGTKVNLSWPPPSDSHLRGNLARCHAQGEQQQFPLATLRVLQRFHPAESEARLSHT